MCTGLLPSRSIGSGNIEQGLKSSQSLQVSWVVLSYLNQMLFVVGHIGVDRSGSQNWFAIYPSRRFKLDSGGTSAQGLINDAINHRSSLPLIIAEAWRIPSYWRYCPLSPIPSLVLRHALLTLMGHGVCLIRYWISLDKLLSVIRQSPHIVCLLHIPGIQPHTLESRTRNHSR